MTAAATARKQQPKAPTKSAGKKADATTTDGKDVGPKYTRKSYPKPKPGFKLYEAGPGGAGYINVRAHDKVMKFAADISDPDATAEGAQNPDWVKGLISRFFPDEEKANRYKEAKEELGYKVRIVEARPYTGHTHDE